MRKYYVTQEGLVYWGTRDGKLQTFTNMKTMATKLSFNEALYIVKFGKDRKIINQTDFNEFTTYVKTYDNGHSKKNN